MAGHLHEHDSRGGGASLLAATPRPRAGLRVLSLADEIIVFDRSRGLSHLLNSSAALVWSHLDGSSTVEEIVTSIAAATGVDDDVIRPDVIALVSDLESSDLLASDPLRSGDAPGSADTSKAPPTVTSSPWIDVRRRVLDARAWSASSIPRRAGGTTVAVRSDDPQVAARLDQILASLPAASSTHDEADHVVSIVDHTPTSATPPGHLDLRLYVDGETLGRAHTVHDAVDRVLTRVNLLAISNTPDRILLHAGAVERGGDVIVVAGVSGRGKSTLTSALVQHGFSYLTDEMVAIDPVSFEVEPYPKAIDLSPTSLELLGLEPDADLPRFKHPVAPSRLGTTSVGGTLRALVLLVADDAVQPAAHTPDAPASDGVAPVGGGTPDDHEHHGLVPLTQTEGIIELLRNTFDETMDIPDALDHIAELCRIVPVLSLHRTDLAHSVELVSALFEDR